MKRGSHSILFLTLFSLSSAIRAANLVCYYPSWSVYREGVGRYDTSNINAALCTHYIYAFAILNPTSLSISVQDPWADISLGGYANFIALRNKNPSAKFLISLGGWSDSTDGSGKYSTLVSSTTKINNFVASVIAFLKLYKFDGLDIDWEVPSTPADKAGYSNLIMALKTAFKTNGYLLSAAVSANAATIDSGYNVTALNQYLDLVNLMTYDYHGASWEPSSASHHSPLYESSTGKTNFNSDYSVKYWIFKGMSPSKITMGIPIYGASWTLTSSVITPPAPANGPGAAGPQTQSPGSLAYYEICNYVVNSGWKVTQDPSYANGPYAVSPSSPKTWVGYDDPAMAKVKANYILSKGLGGGMVWDISMDDFLGTCKTGVNPVLSTLSSILVGSSPTTTPVPTTTTTTGKSTVSTTSSKPTTTVTIPSSKATTAITSATTTSKNFACPSPNGLFPDPASCTTFFSCANGWAFKMNCPTGLYFNPSILTCDYPANVKCFIVG